MQRRSVVLPLPDGPMMLTTSPRRTSRSTPSSTVTGPKLFLSPRMRTTGWSAADAAAAILSLADIGIARFEQSAQARQAIVDREIDQRPKDIERHRHVGAPDHLLDGEHEIDDADQRQQRGPLHRVGDAVDPRRQEAA